MKILIIFTLYLISGGVVSIDDVIGFPGGRVIITCKNYPYGEEKKYFCKLKTETECEKITVIEKQQRNMLIQKDRIDLYDDSSQVLSVTFRQLSSEDAGLYRCGEFGGWNHLFNLRLISDSCCRSKTVTGYLGEKTTISCTYPEQYERHTTTFYKLDSHRIPTAIDTTNPQTYRFSEDRTSKAFNVRISDVREEDGGVYYFAASGRRESFSYISLYAEIQLQVTEEAETAIPTGVSSHPVTIITVCVCLALLLIGGSALIIKLRCDKTQGSVSTTTQTRTHNTADSDYENDPPGNQIIISMGPIYQSLDPNTNQSDLTYQSLNPNTNQSDSDYQSLNPTTNQSDSAYQSLNPNTNQSDLTYQSLNPNTNQSDSGYQSLNPTTNQSDTTYQNLHFNTK